MTPCENGGVLGEPKMFHYLMIDCTGGDIKPREEIMRVYRDFLCGDIKSQIKYSTSHKFYTVYILLCFVVVLPVYTIVVWSNLSLYNCTNTIATTLKIWLNKIQQQHTVSLAFIAANCNSLLNTAIQWADKQVEQKTDFQLATIYCHMECYEQTSVKC